MNLCIDIGNSFIKIGAIDDGTLVSVEKIPTITRSTKEVAGLLDKYSYDNLFLSSVVPSLDKKFIKASHTSPKILNIKNTPLPIKHGSIGADILAFASYVAEKLPLPAIVFSLGTATTAITVDENKEITGGLIMPGMNSGLKGLVESASLLPEVSLSPADGFFKMDTKGAINNGVFYQTIATLEWIAAQKDAKTNIVTGGGVNIVGKYLEKESDIKFICDEFLVLKGLDLIFG